MSDMWFYRYGKDSTTNQMRWLVGKLTPTRRWSTQRTFRDELSAARCANSHNIRVTDRTDLEDYNGVIVR